MKLHKELGFVFLLVCIWFTLFIQEINEQKETYFFNDSRRYCDPKLGRFISPDVYVPDVSFSQDWNRYSYVRNNPLKYTDPDGHVPRAGGESYPTPERLVIAGVDLSKIQVDVEETSSWNFGQMGMKGMRGLNALNPFSGSEAHAASRGSSGEKLDFAMGELNAVYWMVHEMEARTKSRPPARSLGEIGSRVLSDLPGDVVDYGPGLVMDFTGGYLGAAAAGSLADGAGDGFFKRAWKKAKGWFSGGRKPPQPGEPGYPPRVHGGSDGPRVPKEGPLLPPGGDLSQIHLGFFPDGTIMTPSAFADEDAITFIFEVWIPGKGSSSLERLSSGTWWTVDVFLTPRNTGVTTPGFELVQRGISLPDWVQRVEYDLSSNMRPFGIKWAGDDMKLVDPTDIME